MEEEKDKFYGDLQKAYHRVPKHDTIMILGDLNT